LHWQSYARQEMKRGAEDVEAVDDLFQRNVEPNRIQGPAEAVSALRAKRLALLLLLQEPQPSLLKG